MRAGTPYAVQTLGCSSPACPITASPTRISAQRPGCHGARLAARTVTSTASASRDGADRVDRVRPTGLATPAPPAGVLALAGDGDGEVQRLVRQRLVEVVELALGRAAVDAVDRRPGSRVREGDGAGLEQRRRRWRRGRRCGPRS